jgi:hypothetical protein
VWGPEGSFIEGNNEIALAIIIVIPLMWYLFEITKNRWIRSGLVAAMALSALASIGSYSRGRVGRPCRDVHRHLVVQQTQGVARLGTRRRGATPHRLHAPRLGAAMSTISEYEAGCFGHGPDQRVEDGWNLAADRPLFGGGYEIYNQVRLANTPRIRTTFTRRTASTFKYWANTASSVSFIPAFLVAHLANRRLDSPKYVCQRRNRVGLSPGRNVAGESRRLLRRRRIPEPCLLRSPYYVMVALISTKWILQQQTELSKTPARPDHVPTVAPEASLGGSVPHAPERRA